MHVESGLIEGRWDIALRDLEYAIGLDSNDDGSITWGELRSKRVDVSEYALSHLQLESEGASCPSEPTQFQVDEHSDGSYAVLQFRATCQQPIPRLEIAYSLLFDLDPQHRGLLQIKHKGESHTAILSPSQNTQSIELEKIRKGWAFLQYMNEGIFHIFSGYDHVLFLLSLLLPSVFCLNTPNWQPIKRFYPVGIEVGKIVTTFTIAHSVTLSLAVLGYVDIPSRWVESAIAASVILAACNNLYPLIRRQRWAVAFSFGLVHGLGFANVLKDLGLPQNVLLLALLAFNLGVELGQLAIVSLFLPCSYAARYSRWYLIFGVRLGSVTIILLASVWLFERVMNIQLLP
ncbi:MAG: HupE/UreJ family protein [Methylococcales bacterium]